MIGIPRALSAQLRQEIDFPHKNEKVGRTKKNWSEKRSPEFWVEELAR